MRALDEISPEVFTSLRPGGQVGKAINNRTDVVYDTAGRGRVREWNTGAQTVSIVPHRYYIPNYTNTIDGAFKTKALALNAEMTSFDTACSNYGSFLQESLCHMLYQKVTQRNMILREYGEGMTNEFVVVKQGERVPNGTEMDWEMADNGNPAQPQEEGIRVVGSLGGVKIVDKTPSFGILWSDPTVVRGPGREAEVSIYAAHEIMERTIRGDLTAQHIFVSRAKDALSLAQDLIDAYCGTVQEFGVYGADLTFLCATISSKDLMSIFKSWGLFAHSRGSLRRLAHWLRWKQGFTVNDGYFVSSRSDFLRVRDWLAHSNTACHTR